MKKFVLFLLTITAILSMSACGGNKYSEFQWPKSDIAGLISQPKSNIGRIVWDNDNGFRIDVAKTSKSDYDLYVDDCWDKGFIIDYHRSDTAFWADNEDGYNVIVMYDKKVMSITMSSPSISSEDPIYDEQSTEPTDKIAEPPVNEPSSSEEISEPSESSVQSEKPLDVLAESSETESSVEETSTEEPNSLYYSTNTLEQAKKGNSGVFAYKRNPGNYYIYWIIDLDEGYAYYFTYGNENGICDRIQIDEDGDLNSYITVTYHDGDSSWQEGLCFKWVRQPDRLINSMADGTQYEFTATDLDDALKLRDGMEIVDY